MAPVSGNHTLAAALGACLIAAAVSDVGGEIYKWVDKNGKVHFGDRPPDDGAESITVRPQQKPDAGLQQRRDRTKRLLDTYAAERSEREQARWEAVAETKTHERNCEVAKQNKFKLEHASHLFERDADGNKRVLDEDEHEHERTLEQACAAVAKWCG